MNRIPLEKANQVLPIFGITSPTQEYERCAREDGIDPNDLYSVVHESPFVIGMDWRGELPETLMYIQVALNQLGAQLEIEMDDEEDEGWVSCDGKRAHVKYLPVDEDDFADVIRELQRIVPQTIEFRAYSFNEGADSWEFAVLLREEWRALEKLEPKWVAEMFKRV